MTEQANLEDIGDLDLEDDGFQAHDTMDSILNSGAPVPTNPGLQGSIPNEYVTPHGAPSPG